MKPLVTIVIGTRPEAIKLSPVILAFKLSNKLDTRVLLSGQHKEMASEVLQLFEIKTNNNLNLMKSGQDLNEFTQRCIKSIAEDFKNFPPDLVLVQGDTTTAFVAALTAFHNKIPIGHVEAGLRTNKIGEPFPEEANRRLISQLSTLHFAPTKKSEKNLIDSKIKENIFITGNTGIDALLHISNDAKAPKINGLNWSKQKVILLTVHRRENWGANLEEISLGIKKILKDHPNVFIICPMHKNPIVRETLKQLLGSESRIALIEPLNYKEMIGCIKNCTLVLTDSGGIQEEAPALGKPVLVLRQNTERQEAIEAKTAKLIGTSSGSISTETSELLDNQKSYMSMARVQFPFGNGNASEKILVESIKYLGL